MVNENECIDAIIKMKGDGLMRQNHGLFEISST